MSISVNKLFLLCIGAYLILFSAKALILGKTVYGDGIYYYSWIRSIVIDRDISFENEYKTLNGTQPFTPEGKIGNVYPIGPAIFWSPFFLWVHLIIQGDGFSFMYQYSIGLVSCLYAIAGIILLYRLLCKYFSDRISFLATAGTAFGTNLLFYGSLDPVNSHSTSFFISSVLLTAIMEKRSAFFIGLLTGLLAMIRTQDAIFLLLAIPLVSRLHLLVSGFLMGFLPQLLSWQALYQTVLKSPYLDSHHYFDVFKPRLIEVLLSPNNGLFLWTPLVAICVLGLFLQKRILFLFLFAVQWYLIASWSFWWQGASFSGRMFISLLPLLSFGLAHILQRCHTWTGIGMISFFSIANGCAILFYLINN
jgi:hypothetical protein